MNRSSPERTNAKNTTDCTNQNTSFMGIVSTYRKARSALDKFLVGLMNTSFHDMGLIRLDEDCDQRTLRTLGTIDSQSRSTIEHEIPRIRRPDSGVSK